MQDEIDEIIDQIESLKTLTMTAVTHVSLLDSQWAWNSGSILKPWNGFGFVTLQTATVGQDVVFAPGIKNANFRVTNNKRVIRLSFVFRPPTRKLPPKRYP